MGDAAPAANSTLSFDAPEERALLDDELAFLLRWRGLDGAAPAPPPSPEALRAHVLAVWRDVKRQAHVYRCVQALSFLQPRAPRHPAYPALLAAARAAAAEGRRFAVADVGCCFGQDTRALVADGVPAACCVAADAHNAYWRAGLRLFGDGDDGGRLAPVRTAWGDWAADASAVSGSDVAAPFAGALHGAMCMYVLHVLSRQQCASLLARLRRCAAPGGRLLGACVGAAEAGEWARTPDGAHPRWLHSEASLREALRAAGWDGEVTVSASPPGAWDAPGAAPPQDQNARLMQHVLHLQFSATAA